MHDRSVPWRVAALATGVSGVMGGWLFLLYVRMIVSPAPQEMREGATLWITRLLLEGHNPYSLAELPVSTNVYGIVYHLVVLPLAVVFGNGFLVHRIVSGLSILGACALLCRILIRERVDPLLAGVGVLMFFASSLYFVAPLARPDGLGVLLSMASISLLFKDKVGATAFVFGLGFALLALATKVYLAFPPFVMAVYVFLFVSRPRGLAYGLAVVGASTAVLLTLTRFYPAYINVSLVSNAEAGYGDAEHLVRQTRDWLVFSLPLTVALIIMGGHAVTRARSVNWRQRPHVFAFASVVNGAVFFLWLGWHPGAHMTYLFQLVTPVIIPALLPAIGRNTWARAAVAAALPVALGLNAHYFPRAYERFTAAEEEFAAVAAMVNAHRNVLGSTEIAGVLTLAGRPVLDSGQSEYFGDASTEYLVPGVVPAGVIRDRWDTFLIGMDNDIGAERFDLIVRSRRHGLIPRDLLAEHYHQTRTVVLDFAWSGQRWMVDSWEPGRSTAPRLPSAVR
jgi:hypothetical protein